MLEMSDRDLQYVMKVLAREGVEAGYFVPTATGMNKSILDAHADLRDFLRLKGVHDYSLQPKGPASKKLMPVHLLAHDGSIDSTMSLYRPESKDGDPRLWVSKLASVASAENLIAVFVNRGQIFLVNLSDPVHLAADGQLGPSLQYLINQIRADGQEIAEELLQKLRVIAGQGWIKSLRSGSTGIGYTLETLLEIRANSSRLPDYKGIEIKSARVALKASHAKTRTSLFSKTPDWALSSISGSAALLNKYGYQRKAKTAGSLEDRRQLYCSLSTSPNSLGHFLVISEDDRKLFAMHTSYDAHSSPVEVMQWSTDVLRDALEAKHRETFWVHAQTKTIDGEEFFKFTKVYHTKGPLLTNFIPMIKSGHVELDYTAKEVTLANGSKSAGDHGYLFKMRGANLAMLFPTPAVYTL